MGFAQNNKKLLIKIGIVTGVYLLMKYMVPLMIPFFAAALIVCACRPLLRWARKRLHIRPPFVMAFLLTVFLLLFLGGICAAGRELGNLAARLGSPAGYEKQVDELLYDCCEGLGELLQMEADGIHVFMTEQLNIFLDHARQNILPGAMGGSWRFLKGVGSWIAAILVTGVAVVLMAADFEKVRELGRNHPFYGEAASVIRGILHSVRGYLKAQLTIMGIVMLLCVAGIWLSGSTSAPVWAGIGTGFLDALPVLGTGTVFLPWILMRVLQGEYVSAVVLGITYALCTVTREFLEPKLIGGRLGILPVIVLMSVYVGVKLYGFGGIFLGPLSVLLIKELWKRAEV